MTVIWYRTMPSCAAFVFFARQERESLQQEKDHLLKKLLEAELDSNAATKQVLALRDTVSRMSRTVSVSAPCVSFNGMFQTGIFWTVSDVIFIPSDYLILLSKHFSYFLLRRNGLWAQTHLCWLGRKIYYCRNWRRSRGPTELSDVCWGSSTSVRCQLIPGLLLSLFCFVVRATLMVVFSSPDSWTHYSYSSRKILSWRDSLTSRLKTRSVVVYIMKEVERELK